MNFSKQVGRGLVTHLQRLGILHGDILDYSCGWGDFAREILLKGGECWGCDWSAASAQRANELLAGRRGWHGASVIGDPHSSHLGREFDLVTCIEIIEHVPEEQEHDLFANLRDMTKVGGSIFLTTPNEENLNLSQSNIYCPFCNSLYHHRQHVRTFDRNSLADTIRKHGFRIREITTLDFECFQLPTWPGVWNVNLRYFARIAKTFPPFRQLLISGRANKRLPHLCALAIKEG
jgi:2-polyprenyl-3-methyl-5-hydroxy-6-metoxy-1,4-benzoquinol methylase